MSPADLKEYLWEAKLELVVLIGILAAGLIGFIGEWWSTRKL